MIEIYYKSGVNRGSNGYFNAVYENDKLKSRGFSPCKTLEEFKDRVIGSYLNGKPIEDQDHKLIEVKNDG